MFVSMLLDALMRRVPEDLSVQSVGAFYSSGLPEGADRGTGKLSHSCGHIIWRLRMLAKHVLLHLLGANVFLTCHELSYGSMRLRRFLKSIFPCKLQDHKPQNRSTKKDSAMKSHVAMSFLSVIANMTSYFHEHTILPSIASIRCSRSLLVYSTKAYFNKGKSTETSHIITHLSMLASFVYRASPARILVFEYLPCCRWNSCPIRIWRVTARLTSLPSDKRQVEVSCHCQAILYFQSERFTFMMPIPISAIRAWHPYSLRTMHIAVVSRLNCTTDSSCRCFGGYFISPKKHTGSSPHVDLMSIKPTSIYAHRWTILWNEKENSLMHSNFPDPLTVISEAIWKYAGFW